MSETKTRKLKQSELNTYDAGSPDHAGTWDVMVDGVKAGRIVKYTYLTPVCRNGSVHVTHYRKETTFQLTWVGSKGSEKVYRTSLKSALEDWGFYYPRKVFCSLSER